MRKKFVCIICFLMIFSLFSYGDLIKVYAENGITTGVETSSADVSSSSESVFSSAVVNGYHHYPNIAYGGSAFAALNAAESSGTYVFNTNNSVQTREMSDSDAPIATYYVDVTKSTTISIPLSFTILNKDYCDSMNYALGASDSSYKFDCEGQQFVNDQAVGYSKVHYLSGPAPTKAGQSIEILALMWTDIAQNSTYSASTYIHALSKIKIRIIGCGASTVEGTATVTSRCSRNYPDVYTTDRTLKVYNVNSGNDAEYVNMADGGVSLTNTHFPVYSTAYAYAYVDSSKYTDLNQTDIEFSHDVQALCGNGGWSWTDVLVASDYSTYSTSRKLNYTVASSDYVSPIYTMPFKLNGKVPSAGESAVITVTSRCNSLGHSSPEQIFYNSDAKIILTVYGIDKTELKTMIETSVDDNSPEDNYAVYLSALEKAKSVYDEPTASQKKIDEARLALESAILNLHAVPQNKLSLKSDSKLTLKDNLLYGDFSRTTSLSEQLENSDPVFFSADGKEIPEPEIIKTGIRIAVKTDGEVSDYADISVLGDVTGDGIVDGQDSVAADLIVKFGSDKYADCYVKAADINSDGRVADYDVNWLRDYGVYLAENPASITPDCIGKNDIVVSADGDDAFDGTYQYPLSTIYGAKELAKTLKNNVSEPITIWIRGGTYRFSSALSFTSDDLENVTYKAFPNEKVEFSGAEQISGFTETTVNGVKAFVTNYSYNGDTDGFNTLYNGNIRLKRPTWPKSGEFNVAKVNSDDALVPGDSYFALNTAFYAQISDLNNFKNLEDVDVRMMHWWKDELLPIKTVDMSTGRITVQKASSMTIVQGDRFLFENVFEALTSPGEWYYDREDQKIFYIPFAGEEAETTVLNLGSTNQIVSINGCSGISFEGITFRDTDWRMQSGENPNALTGDLKYYSDMTQACYDVLGTIDIKNSENIVFKSCDFRMIGSSGIKFGNGTTNCSVVSSLFQNIGGNPIYIRGVNDANSSDKTHNIDVKDCLIETYGRVFNNAVGILLIHAYNCNLENNEIHDGYYTGISCGWVWGYADNISNNNLIANNLIYDIGQGWLSDMGGIYTLGMQPDTVIRNNVIYNVGCSNDSAGYGGWGIYLDEGSSGISVTQNLVYNCSSDGFHQHYGKFNNIYNNIFALNGEAQMKLSKVESHPSFYAANNILLGDNTSIYANCEQNSFGDSKNIYWDITRKDNVYSGSLNKSDVQDKGFYVDGIFADPMFNDPYSFDFTFKSDETISLANFTKWDYSTAGTITDFQSRFGGSNTDGKAVTVTSTHNFYNVAAGGSKFTVYGADAVSAEEYSFNSDVTAVTRDMNDADAPVATFYIDTQKNDSVKIKLGFEIINKDYCDIMNYCFGVNDNRYSTSAAAQVFVNNCGTGTKRVNYLTGYAPQKVGETVEFTATLWTDMAQNKTYSSTSFIHAGAKIKIRLVGV